MQGARDAMLAMHRAGALDAARAGYERLLVDAPGCPDVLGLLGVLALQQGRDGEAEALLTQALAAPEAEPAVRLRNLNNLFALLTAQQRADDARRLATTALPDWPAAAGPGTAARRTLLSLAEALSLYGASERALALLESALGHLQEDAEALALAGALRLKCGDPAGAVPELRLAGERDPDNWRTLATLSVAEHALGHRDAALAASELCARAIAVYNAPAEASQTATILTLNRSPGLITAEEPDPHELHFARNYIGQASRALAGEFRFASVFADLPDPLPPLPEADVVFNNFASGEVLGVPGVLDRVQEVIGRIGRPVINPPAGVAQTTRQRVAEALQGIPGLVVPRVLRLAHDMERFDEIATAIADELSYPVILRHVAADESSESLISEEKTAIRVENAPEARQFLEQVDWPQFYAIQYVDLRKADGNFRKLRVAVFPDEIILISCGFFSDWMVSGWRHYKAGQSFYDAFPDCVRDMHRTLADPEAVLGPDFMGVFEAVRARLPLDVYGIDFDIDDDGRVVLFEAQATMTLLMPRAGVPEHLQYPRALLDQVNNAFRRLVAAKIGRAL